MNIFNIQIYEHTKGRGEGITKDISSGKRGTKGIFKLRVDQKRDTGFHVMRALPSTHDTGEQTLNKKGQRTHQINLTPKNTECLSEWWVNILKSRK